MTDYDIYEESKKKTKRYEKLKKLLKIIYGYDNYKPKQYEIINKILNKEDVCAILPTGYGKSLTFQIPGLYLDKPTIIISPLISLMNDQKIILEKLGISICCYNSDISDKKKIKEEILSYKYKFIYSTPESIINIKDFLIELNNKIGLSLIAIDEAHCISSYGHDFRKSYRELTFIRDIFKNIPILAVTATATENVAKDICKVLKLNNNNIIKTSFDRPNLYLHIEKNKDIKKILNIIKKHENESIIIYCLTKKETEKIANIIKDNKYLCDIYHSGLNNEQKKKSHNDFINNEINIIVATIAFGMGINKKNVRVVIHYGAPKTIENYYQEIGRAGRDGNMSYCYVFYNYSDFIIQNKFIENCEDKNYKKVQYNLLDEIKNYLETKKCRRKILLNYFNDIYDKDCNLCDICNPIRIINKEEQNKKSQNVEKEAKYLINLIKSIKNRNFGINMYINILRGSNNKDITINLKKNEYYGIGKKKSFKWWKELSNYLLEQNFIQTYNIKSGLYSMQVIKITHKGLTLVELDNLKDFINESEYPKLENIEMENII